VRTYYQCTREGRLVELSERDISIGQDRIASALVGTISKLYCGGQVRNSLQFGKVCALIHNYDSLERQEQTRHNLWRPVSNLIVVAIPGNGPQGR
jgi:hypothetical protein